MRPIRLGQFVVFAALVVLALSSGNARAVTSGTVVAPNPVNLTDCNGYSPAYPSLKPAMKALCTDPLARDDDGDTYRFADNGHYIGHDEPSVKFLSSAPNSGNTMTYYMQLGVDPKGAPTPDGTTSDYAELSIAPWFGLPICDGKSYPQNPCTPDSDANTGLGSPNDAGSAFMELQFYAPGFGPFKDAPSCDQRFYCSALTIDSLECTFGFATCNNNCIEPVNFAYLQRDGVPAGPPSPQLSNDFSLTPNGQTLKMNQGDALRVSLADTPAGFRVEVDDLTTGQRGFMVASAANGFMNTNIADCSGTPFSFHPEYNTAAQQNQVPWAALEGGVLMQQEIGHFESCDSVTNPLGIFNSFDPQTFQTCVGGVEGSGQTGEGPCNFNTGVCSNATTEGGGPCPTNDFTSNALCEFSDGVCAPKGSRTTTLDVGPQVWSWAVAGCVDNITQNGDLDFDGNSYRPDWPDGASNHPKPFRYAGPFDAAGHPYPSLQIETNAGGSEANCDFATGAGCKALPDGAAFYPYWTIGKQKNPFDDENSQGNDNNQGNQNQGNKVCLWNFGNTIPGTTSDDLGKLAEYGSPNLARFAGTLISDPMPNPQLNRSCTR